MGNGATTSDVFRNVRFISILGEGEEEEEEEYSEESRIGDLGPIKVSKTKPFGHKQLE